jgi:hypothetical protein
MSVGSVSLSDNLSPDSVYASERLIPYNLQNEVFLPGDEFKAYQDSTFEDCFIPYKVGKTFSFLNIRKNGVPYFSPLWFGFIEGVGFVPPDNNVVQLCFHSWADLSDGTVGKRITNQDSSQYGITVLGLNTTTDINYKYPEISYFFTEYGGTINSTTKVSFGISSYPLTTNLK